MSKSSTDNEGWIEATVVIIDDIKLINKFRVPDNANLSEMENLVFQYTNFPDYYFPPNEKKIDTKKFEVQAHCESKLASRNMGMHTSLRDFIQAGGVFFAYPKEIRQTISNQLKLKTKLADELLQRLMRFQSATEKAESDLLKEEENEEKQLTKKDKKKKKKDASSSSKTVDLTIEASLLRQQVLLREELERQQKFHFESLNEQTARFRKELEGLSSIQNSDLRAALDRAAELHRKEIQTIHEMHNTELYNRLTTQLQELQKEISNNIKKQEEANRKNFTGIHRQLIQINDSLRERLNPQKLEKPIEKSEPEPLLPEKAEDDISKLKEAENEKI